MVSVQSCRTGSRPFVGRKQGASCAEALSDRLRKSFRLPPMLKPEKHNPGPVMLSNALWIELNHT